MDRVILTLSMRRQIVDKMAIKQQIVDKMSDVLIFLQTSGESTSGDIAAGFVTTNGANKNRTYLLKITLAK